jgi:hypothetical protein
MEWICNCGKPVTTMGIHWEWRDAAAIGHREGRFVAYRTRLGCTDCVRTTLEEDGFQSFAVRLTGATKAALVPQLTAQILKQGPEGYVPKTDLQRALRSVTKRK